MSTDGADDVLARLDEIAVHVDAKIAHVHDDVRSLRPRVETVESEARRLAHLLEGNPERVLPSGERDRGLLGDVHDHGQVIAVVRSGIRVGKWLSAFFATATVALISNILANLL